MRYRTFGITVAPHGTGQVLVHSRRSGTTRLLARPQAHLLLACTTFRTLPDHAARNGLLVKALEHATGASTPTTLAPVEHHLQAFVDDGFLVTEAELRDTIRVLGAQQAEDESPPPTVTTLGIPTCDRPELLGRALAGYVENAMRYERDLAVTVMDDSRDARTQALNRDTLQDVQRRFGVSIRYATRNQRGSYADELAQHAGVSSHVVRFALLGDDRYGPSYGATRNALLLDAVGEVMVQADDDTVCRVTPVPDLEKGLTLTSGTEANELWFFARHEDALAAVAPVDVDFFGLHEQLLGKSPTAGAAEVEDGDEDLDVSTMEADFFEHLHATDARVAVSFIGTVGDAGARYAFRFLHGGRTFNRLVASEPAYRLGMTTRQMIKAARRRTVSDGTFCMTTNVGFDHRALLPPFVPVLRNEDGVFGTVLSARFPGSFSGYVPYTVLHSPPEERSLYPDTNRTRYTSHLANGLLMWIVAAFRDPPASPESARNVRSLGHLFQELGNLPPYDFAAFLRTTAARAMHANVVHAERQLEERRGAPVYWVADVQAYLQAARESVVHPDFAVPSDLPGDAAERLTSFQALIETYGTLLLHWPDIVEAARELRGQDRRLASAV